MNTLFSGIAILFMLFAVFAFVVLVIAYVPALGGVMLVMFGALVVTTVMSFMSRN